MRVSIWVRPGSVRPWVGGEHAGFLVVRVSEQAADGKATTAALAAAFDVPKTAVTLVTGASSRSKIAEVAGGDPVVLRQLLRGSGSTA